MGDDEKWEVEDIIIVEHKDVGGEQRFLIKQDILPRLGQPSTIHGSLENAQHLHSMRTEDD